MACSAPYTRTTNVATTLRDFAIQGAAEIGACARAQSFRATRREDGAPVLLHKFRPAASLTALGPIIVDREPPDFRKPFVTRFTDFFAVAGSAYLVEPLPVCSTLSDTWRHVLQKRPHDTLPVMTILLRQTIAITHQLASQGRCHGALDLPNVVLAPTGCFGLLATHMECQAGILWLRRNSEHLPQPDIHGLVSLLVSLLDLDTQTALLQQRPLRVPTGIHRRIRSLLAAVQRASRHSWQPSRS
ncbi:MAG: hypothetical protein KBE65_10945 [Phycisphaerae bacterium]|nr:hypothetical protein [Phycisphaerae bacterium]